MAPRRLVRQVGGDDPKQDVFVAFLCEDDDDEIRKMLLLIIFSLGKNGKKERKILLIRQR